MFCTFFHNVTCGINISLYIWYLLYDTLVISEREREGGGGGVISVESLRAGLQEKIASISTGLWISINKFFKILMMISTLSILLFNREGRYHHLYFKKFIVRNSETCDLCDKATSCKVIEFLGILLFALFSLHLTQIMLMK